MRALVLADGQPPRKRRLRGHLRRSGCFVVTDGAARLAARWGLVPDAIIGDMDSYQGEFEGRTLLVRDPDQETNDLEKALAWVLSQGVQQVVVLGATGRRLDHTLKNLSVMRRFQPRFERIWLEDEDHRIELIRGGQELIFDGPVGLPVSLFPLSGRAEGIWTEGLRWALRGEALENGVRDGSSNELSARPARVRLERGDLLILITHPSRAGFRSGARLEPQLRCLSGCT
ncbi:MAG: thiamine diphosphokinase [Bacteroidetes bacterium]|nr:thiamine diphosphokinase [Rhodothermia bacterium]MCS7155050.1 thiamine diphosphokinase [Bacteroidota bacterium]MCX7907334.1 thiamine diphosphokinase [Bacteroidota bacterium]MDW8137939.1 thiamine diphosphokinase [Bacteroidota bacterium]MDW8286209.1 thiamine diphosphokinase [Bacteroidota bacterium]